MNKKIVLILVAAMSLIGGASAASVEICTTDPAQCIDPLTDSTPIVLYKDVDAGYSPGLYAKYIDWADGDTYKINVWGAPFTPVTGFISGSPTPFNVYYDSFVPTDMTPGKYVIEAEGKHISGTLRVTVIVETVPNITPELPTSVLMSVGLVGMIGLLKYRRKYE